ncbi:MAG: hypothetical protein ACRDH5_10655, partial [bacterium]
NPTNDVAGSSGPAHTHDAVALDLFFLAHDDAACQGPSDPDNGARTGCGAPRFTVVHGGFRDGPGGTTLTGRPPRNLDGTCATEDLTHGEGADPLTERVFIVCDIDDDSGEFHKHDGSQTIGGV